MRGPLTVFPCVPDLPDPFTKGPNMTKTRKPCKTFPGILALFLIATVLPACARKMMEKDDFPADISTAGEENGQEEYTKGLEALKADDYKTAIKYLTLAADKGNSEAMLQLGHCCNGGWGVEKSPKKAVEWFRKAADKGNARAMSSLGQCYEAGEGVKQDKEEAARWYRKALALDRKASEEGDAEALLQIGLSYSLGNGVKQDKEEAVKWFRKAAEKGSVDAMAQLAFCYEYGLNGLKKDPSETVKWYRKAAEKGDAFGMTQLALRYEYGDGVEEDKEEALKWYRKAAEKGDDFAKKQVEELTGKH